MPAEAMTASCAGGAGEQPGIGVAWPPAAGSPEPGRFIPGGVLLLRGQHGRPGVARVGCLPRRCRHRPHLLV